MKKNKPVNFLPYLVVIACMAFFFYPNLQAFIHQLQRYCTTHVILSQVAHYSSESSDSSVIYYTESDIEFIPLIQRTIDLYYPVMAKDFQIQGLPKLRVILYPDMETIIQNTNNDRGQAPMGVYYGEIIHILSPRVWAPGTSDADRLDAFLEQGPLIHEIAHYLTDLKTGGKCELWFTEGVSLYYEYKYTTFEWRKDLKEEAERLTFGELIDHFNQLNQALAYRKAFDLINELVEREGEAALQTIITDSRLPL